MEKKEWTFLTNHSRLLIYMAKHPQSTNQEIAQKAHLSIRAVQNIISDLEQGGYVVQYKEGRCNRHVVQLERPMRHSMEWGYSIGDILLALEYKSSKRIVSDKEVNTNPTKV